MGIYTGLTNCDNPSIGSSILDSIYFNDIKIWPTSILESFDATLLWTNASSTSNFSSSSISVNYTDYDFLWIFFKIQASEADESFTSSAIASQLIWTGNTSNNMIGSVTSNDSTKFYQYCRKIKPLAAKTSLTISSTGYYQYVSRSVSGSYSSSAKWCIPLRIYGVTRNPKGQIKSLNPTWYADHSTSYSGMMMSETATSLSLIKHYKYLFIDYWTRDEIYTGFNYNTNWFALNQASGTRSSVRLGTTTYSSSQITIMQEETTKWISGGHRYESSMDLWRTREFTYSGTTISCSSVYPWVCSGTKPYCNQQGDSGGGIKMIWGTNDPLW